MKDVVLYTTHKSGYTRMSVDEAHPMVKSRLQTEISARNTIHIGDLVFTRDFMDEAIFNRERDGVSPLLLLREDDQRNFTSIALDVVRNELSRKETNSRTGHLQQLEVAMRSFLVGMGDSSFDNTVARAIRRYRPLEGTLPGKERR